MGHWDVRLLTVSYRRVENDEIAIEMYGKTIEGKSITVRYVGFKPYFHILEPTKDVVEGLRKDPNVIEVRPIELFHKGSVRKAAEVVIKFPWMVPDFRSRLRPSFEILAADIPFHNRFIYDFDIGTCVRVYGHEVDGGGFTTDIVANMDKVDDKPKFEDIPAFNPSLKILAFDVEN
ncbi:MAG: DNA polymerase II, partial [Methanomassiliicoccales archaeon]|nr:DNA polymerase II [Methanomassiliicoccales archaeon]